MPTEPIIVIFASPPRSQKSVYFKSISNIFLLNYSKKKNKLSCLATVPLLLLMESLQWSLLWWAYEFFIHICQRDEQEPFCVFSVIVGPKVPRAWGHRPQPHLSSLWAPLEGLKSGPWDGLHKVVGDLPLVLKQIFNLCTVCIACRKKEHSYQWQSRGEMKMNWERGRGPHLHDIHTCKLCGHHICTDISWHCSWSQTRPCPSRGWLPPAKRYNHTRPLLTKSPDSLLQQQMSLTLWLAAVCFSNVTNIY